MPPKKARTRSIARWLLLLPIPLLWGVLMQSGLLDFVENRFLDWRFKYRGEIAAPVKLIYIDVDTPAIEVMGERPWSRALYANAAQALLETGGAKAIGFDFVFSKISPFSGRRELARALGRGPARGVLVSAAGRDTSLRGSRG